MVTGVRLVARGGVLMFAALPGCGALLGVEEKFQVSEDGGGPGMERADAATAGPDSAPDTDRVNPTTTGRDAQSPDDDVATAIGDAAPPTGPGDCTACPVCQECGPLARCVPAIPGSPCTLPHATAACNGAGSCAILACAPFAMAMGTATYLDCDGDSSNGCESSPDSASSCGACGVVCANRCAKMGMVYACKTSG